MLFFNAGESGKVTRNPYPEAHLTKSSNSPPPSGYATGQWRPGLVAKSRLRLILTDAVRIPHAMQLN